MSLEFISGLTHIHHVAKLINEYFDNHKISDKRKALNKEYHRLFEYSDHFQGLVKKYSDRIFEYNSRVEKRKPEYEFMHDVNKLVFNPDVGNAQVVDDIPRWYFQYTPWIDD